MRLRWPTTSYSVSRSPLDGGVSRLAAEAELANPKLIFFPPPCVQLVQCLSLCRSPLKIQKMNFDQILPYVPKGVASILNNNMDKAVFEVSVRDCVANDKSIQFCGPVAGSIQYM